MRPISRLAALVIATCLGSGATTAGAQAAHVVFVKAAGCNGASPQRTQTGFRVRGVRGIVTALHGVAGCRTIVAANDDGEVLWSGLRIVQADVSRDVAVVSSDPLSNAPDAGFVPLAAPIRDTVLDVWVYGHPYAMKTQPAKWIAFPPPRQLVDLVPPLPAVIGTLRARNSPAPASPMLRVQGNVLPGHSGAPVLSADGHLLGVVNGGLYGGTVGQSWAVPWPDIHWSNDNAAWARLSAIDPGVLFSIDDRYLAAFPIIVSQQDSATAQLGPGRLMRTDVQLLSSGSVRAQTTVAVDDSASGGFCGIAVIVLLDARDAVLASRSLPVPSCAGAIAGTGTPATRTDGWSASVSDSVVAAVARIAIRHTASAPGAPAAVVTVDSTTAVRLPFLGRRITARAHTYFEGSGHVLVEAALSGDTTVRVVSRFENDNVIVGFRARLTIVVQDSAGNTLTTVPLSEVERRPKAPGKAMCTDIASAVAIPSAIASSARKLAVAVRETGRFASFALQQPGFRCVERPFAGPAESLGSGPAARD